MLATRPLQALGALEDWLARPAAWFAPVLLLATRLHVGWAFVKSGWLKLGDWSSTLALFEYEYRVPLLSPAAAAVAGTAGELLFGVLVMLGLAGRASALGLSAVNAMAVIAYGHVLLAEGFEAAIAQHLLWGFMLLVLFATGPGALALDRWLRRSPAVPAPPMPTLAR